MTIRGIKGSARIRSQPFVSGLPCPAGPGKFAAWLPEEGSGKLPQTPVFAFGGMTPVETIRRHGFAGLLIVRGLGGSCPGAVNGRNQNPLPPFAPVRLSASDMPGASVTGGALNRGARSVGFGPGIDPRRLHGSSRHGNDRGVNLASRTRFMNRSSCSRLQTLAACSPVGAVSNSCCCRSLVRQRVPTRARLQDEHDAHEQRTLVERLAPLG